MLDKMTQWNASKFAIFLELWKPIHIFFNKVVQDKKKSKALICEEWSISTYNTNLVLFHEIWLIKKSLSVLCQSRVVYIRKKIIIILSENPSKFCLYVAKKIVGLLEVFLIDFLS